MTTTSTVFVPRPKQQEVIDYSGGKMGVAAVPGSGKTRTLSYLAAKLVAEGGLSDDQEVLIVTLTNSATDNFARQVGEFVRGCGLLAGVGYRVRTLHGLASDIVRDRATLVGLGNPFTILDQSETDRLLSDAVDTWIRLHPRWYEPYAAATDEAPSGRLVFQWRRILVDLCGAFIRKAKDYRLSPSELIERLAQQGELMALAEMASEIFAAYQGALIYRGGVDFEDLIGFALDILKMDSAYLAQLQHRWPFVLEDEAQDSSALQEKLLRLITEKHGNWVRVGDPNQAIYETFTTASPEHLRDFLKERDVMSRELPNSGRATPSLMKLANRLAEWSRESHPSVDVRAMRPLDQPDILPTPEGDPQPNPSDRTDRVHLDPTPRQAEDEKDYVIRSIRNALRLENPPTIAVLVPRNDTGAKFVERLQAEHIEYFELLRTPSTARQTVEYLGAMIAVLARPHETKWLEDAFDAWVAVRYGEDSDLYAIAHKAARQLISGHPEQFAFTQVGESWEEAFPAMSDAIRTAPELAEAIEDFRATLGRWLEATVLPVDQLLLTVGQELFRSPFDLAVTYSLAVAMRRDAELNPALRLTDVMDTINDIVRSRKSIYGIGGVELEFNPDLHPGKVTVSTMHRAKGLEWDRVYLTSVNNYDFPSDEAHDTYVGEPAFVRDFLNLEAEALAQLQALAEPEIAEYVEGEVSRRARLDFVAERLRLLYVGMTRARKELIVTTNTGKGQAQPAAALVALDAWWRSNRDT